MGPDRFAFVPVMNACASLWALEEGRQAAGRLTNELNQSGFEDDLLVGEW
jgi:hypothetical protein